MARNSFILFFKKLPKGFFVALALIAIFETCNAIYDNHFYLTPESYPPDLWFEGLRVKVKNAYSQKPGKNQEVLVLGDSHYLVGVIPEIIKRRTGLDCFNYSTHRRHTIFASYLLLKNHIEESEKKPTYLIIGFLPETLSATKKDIMQNNLPYLFDFKDGNICAFIKEFGVYQGIRFLLPSLKHQWVFKGFFKHPLATLARIPDKRDLDQFITSVAADKGYYAWYAKGIYKGKSQEGTFNPVFSISSFSQKYITQILELSQKNNIEVIYLRPSAPSAHYAISGEKGITSEYKGYVGWLKEIYRNLVDVSLQDELSNDDVYVDRRHLNGVGARILSNGLSQVINDLKPLLSGDKSNSVSCL